MSTNEHYASRTLYDINIDNISPNPFNPRLIFDPEDLNELKKSIAKVGILVPLTVYRNNKKFPKTEYILLDGERRWRCCRELGINEIPANVIDEPSDDTQNILYMFNIHHFRKEWALFPTALKLQVVIDKLGTNQESVLSEFTGVSRSTIRRCKMLLWYPHKYRDILLEKSGKISTDFFIELHPIVYRLSNEDEYSYPTGTEQLVDNLIVKFTDQKVIYDVKEFRELRKSIGFYESTNNFQEFLSRFKEFINNRDTGLEIFSVPEIEEDRNRKNINRYISFLNSTLPTVNPELISDLFFVEQLKQLGSNVKNILEKID